MIPVTSLKRVGQHIRTLASLHDLLTLKSMSGTENDIISLSAMLINLTAMFQQTSGGQKILVDSDEMFTTLKQGSSFALLVNELVSNALKHGRGVVEITLRQSSIFQDDSERLIATLEVCDNGEGFPANFNPKVAANTGLQLIESLSRWDLRGEAFYENRPEGGGLVRIVFALAT